MTPSTAGSMSMSKNRAPRARSSVSRRATVAGVVSVAAASSAYGARASSRSAASSRRSAAGSRFVPRHGGARVLCAGLVALAAGLAAAALAYGAAPTGRYPLGLPFALALAGLGVGLFTAPFFTLALRPVSDQEAGSAAGLLNAVQQLGGTLGVAVTGGVYLTTTSPHQALTTSAALLALTAPAAWAMPARPRTGH
ncbi:hypothetical protein [Streptomyces sp. SKN60]|uniref:hypothetical protein n=1 Tax=Streptomyces sp. SKN60 TaxID=2855506 RepID=UPI0022478ABC|nr:hypothetical protein [Streptomyces sp. SKN60]